MAVIMPKTGQPMTIDEQNVVAVLTGVGTGLRREEIARMVASPNSSAAKVDTALAALIAGDAVAPADDEGRYRLTPAGERAAQFGVFGQ